MKMTSVGIVGSNAKGDDVIPYLVEVTLKEPSSSSFLQVRETLTRIGISASKIGEMDSLYQTCHILSKFGKHYIVHFKTLFVLDGRENNISEGDIARQNLIIRLLADWGLINIENPSMMETPMCSMSNIKIIPFQDKSKWRLVQKFNIGAYVKGKASNDQNQTKFG
jgi:hypothetical protein